jgi:diketogulonate reductase-like aldo/keto reductase
MLRWSLQHGNIILPKSTNPERIGENLAVFDFELTGEEMARLDGLNEDFRTCWDPSELV